MFILINNENSQHWFVNNKYWTCEKRRVKPSQKTPKKVSSEKNQVEGFTECMYLNEQIYTKQVGFKPKI